MSGQRNGEGDQPLRLGLRQIILQFQTIGCCLPGAKILYARQWMRREIARVDIDRLKLLDTEEREELVR